MGRPAAYLKDGGSEVHKAADVLEARGLGSPCIDELPACKDLIKRFCADAQGLRACQQIVKTKGLCHDTLTQCQPLISEMPSAPLRLEFAAYLAYQLETAKT